MTIDLEHLNPGDYTPTTPEERAACAVPDLCFHDQHGDSCRWTAEEEEAYHRLLARVLDGLRNSDDR